MAIYDVGNPSIVESEGIQVNPVAGTVMADSGPVQNLVGANYEARIVFGASAAAVMQVERRNAANGANVGDVVVLFCGASSSEQVTLRYVLEPLERIRVTMQANLAAGSAAATVNLERLS